MFGQNLKNERARLGLTQPQLADFLQVSKRTLVDWEQEKSSPTVKQLMMMKNIGINILDLLGESAEILTNGNPNDDFDNEFTLIPFYDVEISAGFGRDSSDVYKPTCYLAYRQDWLKQRRLQVKNLVSTRISGDSMEPTIPDNSTILIDKSRHQPRDGHIYVLRSGDTYWVKRLQIQPSGSLVLISDNGFYPPMTLDLKTESDVEIVGQVVNVSKELL